MDKNSGRSRRGSGSAVDLGATDVDAMDVVLSLLPDARLAAVAVARMADRPDAYPIRTVSEFARSVGASEGIEVGGHMIDPSTLRTYLAAGDLPVEAPIDLANVVLAALGRCRQHLQLRESLGEFEDALRTDPDPAGGQGKDAGSGQIPIGHSEEEN